MPVAEDAGGHVDALAHGALHRIASAVDLRRHPLDLDARRRLGWFSEVARRGRVSRIRGTQTAVSRVKPPCSCRAQPESSCIRRRFPAGGSATRRTASSTGSRPRGSRGGRCCRSGRRTSSARRTARPLRSPARRGLLAEPNAHVSADEIEDFVARHPYWMRRLGALRRRRRDRRPGALRARMGRRCARTAASAASRLIGDVPIYVSDVGADVEAWPELFAQGEVAGAPPDALSANGQHWGNPLYDWHAHRATGYRWWIERFRRVFELVDVVAHRPLPRLRLVLGDPGAPQDRAPRHAGSAAPAPSSSTPSRERSATLPLIAEDLGVITPPVRRAPRRARPTGDRRAALGVRRLAEQPACAAEPPREPRRLHEHARHRHGRRLVRVARQARARGDGPRPERAALGADRARATRRARRSRSSRRRTCSGSAARRA